MEKDPEPRHVHRRDGGVLREAPEDRGRNVLAASSTRLRHTFLVLLCTFGRWIAFSQRIFEVGYAESETECRQLRVIGRGNFLARLPESIAHCVRHTFSRTARQPCESTINAGRATSKIAA